MNRRIVGLLALSAVPMLAGIARLIGLSTGAFTLGGEARFLADPVPAVLHIVGATSFATLGALQFLPSLRRGSWHRIVGRGLSVLGSLAALAGTWMVWRWPAKEFEGPALQSVRLVVATAMVVFIVRSVRAARRRDFVAHEAWATRAYALWAGAGTQVFTLLPFTLPFLAAMRSPGFYAVCMSAGWVLNVAVAEWSLRSSRSGVRSVQVAS